MGVCMYPYAFKCMIQKNGAKFATQHQLLHDLGQIRPNASKKSQSDGTMWCWEIAKVRFASMQSMHAVYDAYPPLWSSIK